LGTSSSFKKSKWTQEEDNLLVESVKFHGFGNWSLVAQSIPGRSGKQCRERWINQLCPALSKDNWTPQEDAILVQQQRLHGNVWSKIAAYLPGRSPNNVKNRWSWLSRHRLSPALAAHMMSYVAQQPGSDLSARRPPMPQIFQTQQTQQTPPIEMQWLAAQTFTGMRSDRLNFSDPLEPLVESSFYPAHSAGCELDLDFTLLRDPPVNNDDESPFSENFGEPGDDPFDAWLPF
jgi:hypothetical protein